MDDSETPDTAASQETLHLAFAQEAESIAKRLGVKEGTPAWGRLADNVDKLADHVAEALRQVLANYMCSLGLGPVEPAALQDIPD